MNLHDVLHRQGYRVFLDHFAIPAGAELVARLEEGLTKSRTGILVWSSATADSRWCMREYQVMEQRSTQDESFRFVTLRVGGELPLMAQSTRWLDFSEHPDGPDGEELLRLLFALAERPVTPEAIRFAADQDEATAQAKLAIQAAVAIGSLERLTTLIENAGAAWDTSATLRSMATEGLIRLGDYDRALTVLDEMADRLPRSIRPKQLRALALARRGRAGDLEDAQEILAMLRSEGAADPETLGIFARTWMDRYAVTGSRTFLRNSRDLYAEAFDISPSDYYTGINAAAKSVFLGDLDEGQGFAQRVIDVLADSPPADYWEQATLAEAHLILGSHADAKRHYQAAIVRAPTERGSLASTLKQASRLRHALKIEDSDWKGFRAAFVEALGEPEVARLEEHSADV